MSDDLGTLAWLERTQGHLDRRARGALLRGIFPMIRDGFRLYGVANHSGHRDVALARPRRPLRPVPPDLLAIDALTRVLISRRGQRA